MARSNAVSCRVVRRSLFWWLLTTLSLAPVACRANDQPARPPDAAAAARAVIDELRQLRHAGRYDDIEPLVAPGRFAPLRELLLSVDALLHANAALTSFVQREISAALAQNIDQSYWAEMLGIFSRDVHVISAQIDGDEAAVTFQIRDHLPLDHTTLRLVNGAWRYDPGAAADPGFAKAFREMADGLRAVLGDLRRDPDACKRFERYPDELVNEVALRLRPGMALLPRPPKEASP